MTNQILETIGNTPLIEIRKLNPNPHVRILAKLEYFNPGGSVKDRTALSIIEDGERTGKLTPDKTVIEATSGNTGIGLALVCSVKGYKLLLTMSEAVSIERQKILQARGAEIRLTPGHLGTDGAIEEVYRLARENPDMYFMSDQFNNEANWKAHYYGTAEEIYRQTEGKISVVVSTLGTSGTAMGLSRRLKEYNPNIVIVGVEPYLGHKIQGLKNMKEAYRPEIYDKKRLDKKVNIDDEDAYEMARRLAKEEGIFVGMSSGAAMVIAQKEALSMSEGNLVVIFPDGGERYLSTSLFAVQEKDSLKLFNTYSRIKEPFEPLVAGKVSMYSCGPTVNVRMNLSQCRRFVFADLLNRYLEYRGYAVKHVVNITDLDDKTIHGSEQAGIELSEYTKQYINFFYDDLALLNIKTADKYPHASEHVQDMIEMSEKLVQKGFAYEKFKSVYYDISRFTEYGKLSGVNIDKIKVGATVDLDNYEKDNPRDFTLLKRSKLSELKRGIYYKTRWGNILPSWHIQCAAMSMKYLGESFDIHTGSRELTFPHHENENAISKSLTGKTLAKYWVHCDRVLVDGKKIEDSSLGLTIPEIQKLGYPPRVLRYFLISTHYSKPISFSSERMEASKQALNRLDLCIHNLLKIGDEKPSSDIKQIQYDLKQGFRKALDDDLNISLALAAVFQSIKRINSLLLKNQKGEPGGIDKQGAIELIDVFYKIDSVLKIFDFGDPVQDDETRRLLQEREHIRKEKDWEKSDTIREQLIAKGVIIKDRKLE